jgi:hypothetical protein
LAVSARPEKFEPLMRRFEHLANRIVLGIIAAAFIAGLAVLLAIYHPQVSSSGPEYSSPLGLSPRAFLACTWPGASCVLAVACDIPR